MALLGFAAISWFNKTKSFGKLSELVTWLLFVLVLHAVNKIQNKKDLSNINILLAKN